MSQYKLIYDEYGGDYFDYNPAHAIWYVLVDLVGIPEEMLDETSFLAAAQTLYDEGRGVSALMRAEVSAKDWVQTVLQHADGVLIWGTVSGVGKLQLKLVRDNYDTETLPVVDVADLLSQPRFDRLSWPETLGEVKVQYNKRIYPPSAIRYTQEVVEVLRTGFPAINYSQEAIEVVRTGDPYAIWIEETFEIVSTNEGAGFTPDCIEDFVVFLWDHNPSAGELPPT